MLVIAHRGASRHEPENTLAAFERAIELGADAVELDVHAADDGSLVVTHDLPRDEPYPALEDVVDALAGRIGLMVELKHPYRYRRHDVVRRTLKLLPEDAFLLCFEPGALREVRQVRTIQHVGLGTSIAAAAGYAWGVGFRDDLFSRRGLARAQGFGLAATVFTVNDPARMRELAGLGVDGIFTDRPDLLRQTLRG